ncbi:MAG: sulfatase, partial [Phycisphaeraceae bacterium]|nr:sulfatase [Phycisphaeraceae bacterium]
MRFFFVGILFIASAAWAKPNVVYINIDDLGIMDLGYTGSTYYETPNIDRLASQAMVFTQGYAPAANCAPSRAACMSGLYGPRTGVLTVASSARGKAATRKLIPIKNKTVLAEKFVTIAEALQATGYATATMGKWHLGQDPTTQGFDLNIAGTTAGHPRSYFSPYHNKKLSDGPKGEHLPARLTDEAIQWIEKVKDKPFFLYLPYFSIHTPIQGRGDLVKKYKSKKPGDGQSNAKYAAMVEAVDEHIGRLLAKLDEWKLTENTLVIFTSDNGGICAMSSQKPFRAGKGSYYEGGIREPLIIRWPAKVKPGRNDTPVSGIDFYPTLLEATGAEKPADTPLDGVSLMPLLTGSGELKPRALFWHFPIYLQAYNKNKDDGRD